MNDDNFFLEIMKHIAIMLILFVTFELICIGIMSLGGLMH